MDITTAFEAVIGGSNPSGSTRKIARGAILNCFRKTELLQFCEGFERLFDVDSGRPKSTCRCNRRILQNKLKYIHAQTLLHTQ